MAVNENSKIFNAFFLFYNFIIDLQFNSLLNFLLRWVKDNKIRFIDVQRKLVGT